MSKVKLQNLFWSAELNPYLDRSVQECGFTSRSEFLRHILKRKFSLCLFDSCYSPATNHGGLCDLHAHMSKRDKNRLLKKGENNGTA